MSRPTRRGFLQTAGVAAAAPGATEAKFEKQQQHFFDLLPEGDANFGLDPSWVSIYPYQILIAAGGRRKLQVRARNYKPSPMALEVSLVAPSEWRIEPDVARFEVPANGTAVREVTIEIPKTWSPAARVSQ